MTMNSANLEKTRMALTLALTTAAVGGACMANNPPSDQGIRTLRTDPLKQQRAPASPLTMDPMDRGGGGAGGGGGGGGGH